jgi:RNA polymerase sigma-70 factor (ECF subfamily)
MRAVEDALPADDGASDEALVPRILRGQKLFFAVLMRRYNQRLFRVARAIVRDDHEAEDVVQHAYVAAYDNLASYRGGAKFSTWLTRITLNEAYGRMRKNKRQFSVVEAGDTSSVSNSDPEAEAYRSELATLLEGHIDELAENLRLVFVLREVQELNTKETAAVLDTTEEVVRIRLHRARHQLQQRLSEAVMAAPGAFYFAGERCDRIVRSVLNDLGL